MCPTEEIIRKTQQAHELALRPVSAEVRERLRETLLNLLDLVDEEKDILS